MILPFGGILQSVGVENQNEISPFACWFEATFRWIVMKDQLRVQDEKKPSQVEPLSGLGRFVSPAQRPLALERPELGVGIAGRLALSHRILRSRLGDDVSVG
jgi:hypothetical protein